MDDHDGGNSAFWAVAVAPWRPTDKLKANSNPAEQPDLDTNTKEPTIIAPLQRHS